MRFEARRIGSNWADRYRWFPTVRVLPEFTLSFERNPSRDVYVYAGWLIFGFELSFCFCKTE